MSKSAQVPLHTWLADAMEGYSITLKHVILNILIIHYMWGRVGEFLGICILCMHSTNSSYYPYPYSSHFYRLYACSWP